MEEEKRIVYKAGITRTPSDFLCQDGELAECINLVTDHEELKPMVEPEPFIIDARTRPAPQGVEIDVPKILYVHKVNGEDRYIGHISVIKDGDVVQVMIWGIVINGTFLLGNDNSDGYFHRENGEFLYYYSGERISSIGNTLIIYNEHDTVSTFYSIWDGDQYSVFTELPKPDVEFYLEGSLTPSQNYGDFSVFNSLKYGDAISFPNFHVDDQEKLNNLIVGLYSKNKNSISRKKLFCEPFFVRTALELYDGSYTYISQPILLFPSVTENTDFVFNTYREDISAMTYGCKLFYNNKTNITKYKDIVKGVALFITDGIDIYDTNSDQPQPSELFTETIVYNTICRVRGGGVENPDQSVFRVRKDSSAGGTSDSHPAKAIRNRPETEILNDIKSRSIFYKLCMLPYCNGSFTNVAEHIDTHTLENIATLERLEYDDYYSFCPINASMVYAYNSRLNLAGVKRGLFEGFDFFMPLYNNSTAEGGNDYWFYVKIQLDNGEQVWVMHRASSFQVQGVYFFYPDPRAKHVTIYNQTTGHFVLDAELKEHPMLNGAYYLRELPTAETGEIEVQVSADGFHPWPWPAENPTHVADTFNNSYKEFLPNYIVQSEVNNPWVFQAEGYNRVGTGKIIGMSTVTQALSQGQFGQYPLLVFSESGIWALSVDGTGLYQGMSPMSREVCINRRSIIQTDGAVFFASKKGLMVITGSDVRCVSEQMNGEAFNYENLIKFERDDPDDPRYPWKAMIVACQRNWTLSQFLRSPNLIMAYDYMDSRIIISDPSYNTFSYVYNIADGSFSKMVLQMSIDNAVNDYPDYLLQGMVTVTVDGVEKKESRVYSLYNKSPEDGLVFRRLGFLLTRPMKLGGPVTVTSLRQLMNVGRWDKSSGSLVKTEAFVSSDLSEWYPLGSRFGAAAKFFRLALYVKMKPLERLSGTILTVQDRRENNMR